MPAGFTLLCLAVPPPSTKFTHLHTETEMKRSLEAFVSKLYAMGIFKAKPPDLGQRAEREGRRARTPKPAGLFKSDGL